MLKDKLYQDLSDQTDKMKWAFSSLKKGLQHDLERSGIEVEEIVDILVGYDKHFKTVLSNCTRMSPLFREIGEYMSFFDYNILEYLIDEYGSDTIKKRLKKYEDEFEDFSKRRVIECPSNAFGESEKSEKVVKLISDKELDKLTVADLRKFKQRVYRILGYKLIKVVKVEGGSVKITFRMFEIDKISITKEQRISLQREGVISITYGDQHIDLLTSCEGHTSYYQKTTSVYQEAGMNRVVYKCIYDAMEMHALMLYCIYLQLTSPLQPVLSSVTCWYG